MTNAATSSVMERRTNFLAILLPGAAMAVPVVGLFMIVLVYTYQFGAAFKARGPLYLTLPLIVVAGVVHFAVPIMVLEASQSAWASAATSFALWVAIVIVAQRMRAFDLHP